MLDYDAMTYMARVKVTCDRLRHYDLHGMSGGYIWQITTL